MCLCVCALRDTLPSTWPQSTGTSTSSTPSSTPTVSRPAWWPHPVVMSLPVREGGGGALPPARLKDSAERVSSDADRSSGRLTRPSHLISPHTVIMFLPLNISLSCSSGLSQQGVRRLCARQRSRQCPPPKVLSQLLRVERPVTVTGTNRKPPQAVTNYHCCRVGGNLIG